MTIPLPFLRVTTSSTYHVAPEDHLSSISNDSHTIEEYLNNASEYFTSNTQLHFLPGYHYLQRDLIIQNIVNFNISGTTDSIIVCNGTKPVGLAIVNITRLTFQNISVMYCGKDYILNLTRSHYESVHNHSEFPPVHWNSALYLYNCTFVFINNISITNNVNVNGLLLVNVRMETKIANLTVNSANKLIPGNKTFLTNGILIYYYDKQHEHNILNGFVDIQNFTYQCNSSNLTISQNALLVILTQLNFNVSITVSDSSFHDLFNASILYYYGESCGVDIWNRIVFNNCTIYNNIGKQVKQLFAVLFHNNGHRFSSIVNKPKCAKHYNIIKFNNCIFSNNSDIITLLYLIPINTVTSNAKLTISHCSFHKNYAVYLIKSRSKVQMLWQMSHYIVIEATNISSNFHKNGSSILSITNGLLKLADIVKITNNSYYFGILDLYLSILKFNGSCIIVNNLARHILLGREGSYYLLKTNSSVKIMNNTVVAVLSYSTVYNRRLGEVCCFQFLNRGHNLDNSILRNEPLYYRIEMINNTYTAPTHLIKPFRNCSWLPDTAFQKADAGAVFGRIFKLTTISIDKSKIEIIPSSICRCNSTIQYDCNSHQLGATYPGHTLTVKLTIPQLIYTSKSSIQLIAKVNGERIPDEHCTIIEATEITQVKLDHGCNEYNYTVWSKRNECEIYLTENQLSGTEIFYVTLLPCPIGFTLQSNARTCSCDSVLDEFTASCNLNDGTVQRAANSWISGKTVNGSHTYDVSLNCPFDYCLSYSSYLNVSNPDQQCRFQRSGALCGHCPENLSTVFGSSQCQKCSNVSLFVVIPIALAGILLVLMLFILNLTVTNGAINTFIFYFNIASINITMFIPICHDSIACITLSLFNLDLGIKSCFYDGMDDYAKTWLQLIFPVYLIFIALILIIGSRHSKLIQRLTARRGLPVLATLFLLSYTKVLLTVCHAIFYYSKITHLPTKQSTIFWSVNTSVPLFGIKFSILFVTCLVLFLILIPFNALLLFTRSLMRFNFISTFKPLLDAYFGPYKDKFYYWTGIQLVLRAIFLALSAFESDVNLTSGIILLGILLCVQGVVHPFKSWLKNVQESVVLLDLLALYVTALYNDSKRKEKLSIAWYLLFPVLVYFIIFVSCHCVVSICGDRIKQKGNNIILIIKSKLSNAKISHDQELIDMETLRSKIPDVTLDYKEFQEPLIAMSD